MVEYKCFRCGYIASQRSNLKNHFKRKKICDSLLDDISINEMVKMYNFDTQPTTTQKQPKTTQNEPILNPINYFDDPKTTQNDPFFLSNDPKTTQNDPFFLSNDPKTTQNDPFLNCCKFCNKIFKRKWHLSRHLSTCKHKKYGELVLIENNNKISEMEKEIKELKEVINKKNTITNINTNTTNTTNNTNSNNTIIINNFGYENIEHLSKQYLLNLFTKTHRAIPLLVEKIHFDPEHPENHNIKVTNKKLNYAEVVKDNKWVTTNKKKAIEDMIQNGYNIIEEKYTDNKEHISERKQERFENFKKKFDEEDKELIKDIKDDINISLINGTTNIHNK